MSRTKWSFRSGFIGILSVSVGVISGCAAQGEPSGAAKSDDVSIELDPRFADGPISKASKVDLCEQLSEAVGEVANTSDIDLEFEDTQDPDSFCEAQEMAGGESKIRLRLKFKEYDDDDITKYQNYREMSADGKKYTQSECAIYSLLGASETGAGVFSPVFDNIDVDGTQFCALEVGSQTTASFWTIKRTMISIEFYVPSRDESEDGVNPDLANFRDQVTAR